MLVALVLAAALYSASAGQAPNLDAHVTYTTRAARAAVVIPELGKLAGVTLLVSPQTANEVLIVSVKDIPLSDVLKRIANVTSGAWKQESGSLRLVADQTRRRQEERDLTAKRTAEIKKRIASRQESEKKLVAEAEKSAGKKEGEGSDENPQGQLLNGSTITGLLAGIDPAVLANIGPNDRLVFSTDPTRTQLRLGSNADAIVANFIEKHNELLVSNPPNINDDGDVSGMSRDEIDAMHKLIARETQKIGAVAKALFVVEQALVGEGQSASSGDDESGGLKLVLYNSQGEILYSVEGSFGSYASDDSSSNAGADMTPPSNAPRGPQTRIRPQSIDGFATKIAQPLKYDPLSFFQTDDLMEYAASKGKPFVADVPDSWDSVTLILGKESGPRAPFVEELIKESDSIATIEDSQFTLIKPSDAVQSRKDRLDRKALQKLMQAGDEKGLPSLDDFAAFALDVPSSDNALTTMLLGTFVPSGATYLNGPDTWNMLQFYGLLDPGQRNTVVQSGRISISKLTVDQKAKLSEILYQSPNSLVLDDGKHRDTDLESGDSSMYSDLMDFDADYRVEPTEVAASGLPDQGSVELTLHTEPTVVKHETRPGWPAKYALAYNPFQLASYRVNREARAKRGAKPSADLGKLRLGTNTLYKFTVRVGPQSVFRAELQDRRLSDDPNEVTDATLPSDFEKLVAEKQAEYKKAIEVAGAPQAGQQKTIHP